MKVLLVNSYTGGHNVVYTKKIAEYLAGHNINVSFLTSNDFNCEIHGVKTIKIDDSSYKYNNLIFKKVCKKIYYKKIMQLDLENKYDIIHFVYTDPETIPMLISFRALRKIKKISKIIGTVHWTSNLIGKEGIKSSFKTFMFNFLKETIDLYFVHGENAKKDLICKLKLNENVIYTIPYGTEPYKKINKQNCRKYLKIDEKEKVFLMFAGLTPYKGFDILLHSLSKINIEITLIIAGMPYRYKDIIEKLKYKNIKIIKYLKYVEDEKIPLFFGASDALLLPYKNEITGQSGPLTIATTYGIPIIGTNVGEIGNTISKYGLGKVIEPESEQSLTEAILEFANYNSEQIEKFQNNCINYCNNNSWDVMCSKIVSCYREIVK